MSNKGRRGAEYTPKNLEMKQNAGFLRGGAVDKEDPNNAILLGRKVAIVCLSLDSQPQAWSYLLHSDRCPNKLAISWVHLWHDELTVTVDYLPGPYQTPNETGIELLDLKPEESRMLV
ncbi:hypothetical protein JHK87_025251 [Glycine soja]|nr:hypothetical protein JHK87_025251 [Glycine soja]